MKLGKRMKKVVILDGPNCGETLSVDDSRDTISIPEREEFSAIDYSKLGNEICTEVQKITLYYIHCIETYKQALYFGSESANIGVGDIINILVDRFVVTAAQPASSSEAQ